MSHVWSPTRRHCKGIISPFLSDVNKNVSCPKYGVTLISLWEYLKVELRNLNKVAKFHRSQDSGRCFRSAKFPFLAPLQAMQSDTTFSRKVLSHRSAQQLTEKQKSWNALHGGILEIWQKGQSHEIFRVLTLLKRFLYSPCKYLDRLWEVLPLLPPRPSHS